MVRLFLVAFLALSSAFASKALADDFEAMVDTARGETVYFNAWGGSPAINDYIAWAGEKLDELYGIDLQHVKLSDTADAVSRIIAEKAAGRASGGSVDLIWINGENFARLKQQGLLLGPFLDKLPNSELIDLERNPTAKIDFAIATDGYEAPWGKAEFVIAYDSDHLPFVDLASDSLIELAEANPGRITYPAPPNFIGTTFLKQLLQQSIEDPDQLLQPIESNAFEAKTAPLWTTLDQLHPHLWRQGRTFPQSDLAQHQLMNDGEVAITFAFNAGNIANHVDSGVLPPATAIGSISGGAIGNTHFLAIPVNANAPEAAMVTANFFLSPLAQARKQDPRYWGDPTVLDVTALNSQDRSVFEAVPDHPLIPPPEQSSTLRPEPHPSWHELLERTWLDRYQR